MYASQFDMEFVAVRIGNLKRIGWPILKPLINLAMLMQWGIRANGYSSGGEVRGSVWYVG